MDRQFLIVILGMAAILYATRMGGLVLAERLPQSPRLDRLFNQLPGLTLVALIAPAVMYEGTVGVIAALLVWLIVERTSNIMLAMLVGVGFVALLG